MTVTICGSQQLCNAGPGQIANTKVTIKPSCRAAIANKGGSLGCRGSRFSLAFLLPKRHLNLAENRFFKVQSFSLSSDLFIICSSFRIDQLFSKFSIFVDLISTQKENFVPQNLGKLADSTQSVSSDGMRDLKKGWLTEGLEFSWF